MAVVLLVHRVSCGMSYVYCVCTVHENMILASQFSSDFFFLSEKQQIKRLAKTKCRREQIKFAVNEKYSILIYYS